MQYNKYYKSDIANLLYIYTISNIVMLLNFQGIYWDDWALYNVDHESIISLFRMNGSMLLGYIHSILLSIGNGIFIYRFLVFLTFFLSGVLIYKILYKHILSSKNSAFWVTLIYLTIPLNSVKIALINTPAIFYLLIFFTAFYLLTEYLIKPKSIWYRVLILFLFFISFTLSSLLVFYAIVLLYLLYTIFIHSINQEVENNFLHTIKVFLKYIDFIIIPIIFYIVKSIYFVPTGLYENYNKIVFNFERITILIAKSFKTSIYDPIIGSINTSWHYWYMTIIILIITYILVRKKTVVQESIYSYMIICTTGILMFFLAVFPYAVVNKLPHLEGWESRHQILMPLGIAFMIYSLVMVSTKIHKNIPVLIFSILITMFTVQNMYNGYRYLKDWYYQVAIEENFKSSKVIQEHTTFVVKVLLEDKLANSRKLSFYEQNGRMKKVFGTDNRFMVDEISQIERYKYLKDYKQYNFSSWKYEKPIFFQINENSSFLGDKYYFFKLLYFQLIDESTFLEKTKPMILIEYTNE